MRPLAILAAAAGAMIALAPAAFAAAPAALPDFSGDWVVEGANTLDPAGKGPAYKPEWAAKVRATQADLKAGKIKDPIKTCGLPAGMPRMLALPDVHEWIVRPEEVWHAVEHGGTVRRIFTDGRPHLKGDDLFPQFTGENVGHWEGDTLVIDTIGTRDDAWLDGAGLLHSEALHVVQRVRLIAPGRLQVVATMDDPEAFARPWTVTRTYRRLPKGSFVHDYACKVLRE